MENKDKKIEELEKELAKQKEITEIWKERYLAENKKLLKLIGE